MCVRIPGVAVLLAAAILLIGCFHGPTGEPRTERTSVPLGSAEMVRARVEMDAGELTIRGGSGQLLEATFDYTGDRSKPRVDYNVTGFRGRLVVSQPRAISSHGDNAWDLRLNNSVPLDLEVLLGAGKSVLDLGSLALRNLDIRLGAGELDLDLTGKWRKDLEVRIRGGVGKATVWLPKDVGVQARARGGIGAIKAPGFRRSGHTYTNDAYEDSPVTLRLDIEGGIGEIRLELSGSAID